MHFIFQVAVLDVLFLHILLFELSRMLESISSVKNKSYQTKMWTKPKHVFLLPVWFYAGRPIRASTNFESTF